MGAQAQDFQFLVSKDGSKILQGNVFDVNNNPFKHDLDKLKTEFEPSLGAPGADVVLVEFSDFQCPYCKEEATMIRQNLLKAYPQNVRLYFKTFPLESLHPWAKPAAIASHCVFRQQPTAFLGLPRLGVRTSGGNQSRKLQDEGDGLGEDAEGPRRPATLAMHGHQSH